MATKLNFASVDELVDSVDKQDLESAVASEWLSGDGDAWLMVGHVCASVHNSLMLATVKKGGNVTEEDFRDAAYYLPSFLKSKTKKKSKIDISLDEWRRQAPSTDWMRSMAGF